MPFPFDEEKDVSTLEASTFGIFSFFDGYEIVCCRFYVKSWASIIWHPFIPPRYYIFSLEDFFDKLPIENQL